MSRSLNRAQIIGNLGTEPELKALASGMAVCRLSIATSESWNDKTTGDAREEPAWHRVTPWGKLAGKCVRCSDRPDLTARPGPHLRTGTFCEPLHLATPNST